MFIYLVSQGDLVTWDNFSWMIEGDINLYPIQDPTIYCRSRIF